MSLAIFIAAGCLTCAAVASAVTYYAVNWSRDRQEENDHARRELAIEHGLRLAQENQQLEQQVSGEQPTVELFDGSHLAEWREHAEPVRIPTPEQAASRCNNCGKPAEFTWVADGFPFGGCALCVELWWPEGLPDHVERIGQVEHECDLYPRLCMFCQQRQHEGECNADQLSEFVVEQEWVHTPCGTPITVDDDGTESCSTCGTVITETAEGIDGLNQWADAIHAEDDGPESLPRVLPEGRVSD